MNKTFCLLFGLALSFNVAADSVKEINKGDVGENGCPNKAEEKEGIIQLKGELKSSKIKEGSANQDVGFMNVTKKVKVKYVHCAYDVKGVASFVHKLQIGKDWTCDDTGKDVKCHKRRTFEVVCPKAMAVKVIAEDGWESTGKDDLKLSDLDWKDGEGICQYGKESYNIKARNTKKFKVGYPFHCEGKKTKWSCREAY